VLAVVQRVSSAQCSVEGENVGKIDKGLLVLLAVGKEDSLKDASWMARKLVNLRIFEDHNQKMSFSLLDVGGDILVVPQFTLYADCKKGHRPNFSKAASAQVARDLFYRVLDFLNEYPVKVQKGVFGARMEVSLVNDGPVTVIVSSDKG